MAFELSRFQSWLDSVMNKYTDVDRFAGAQCWDLAAAFSRFFGLPVINTTGGSGKWAGYAGTMYRDYPQTPAIEAAYVRVPASEPGQAGDLAVWGDSFWYYPATHVAVVISDEGPTHLRCASQNSSPARWDNPYPGQSSGPTMDQWLPKQGLLGYLRPRSGLVLQGEIIQPEEDIMATLDEVRAVVREEIAALTQEGEATKRNAGPLFGVAGNAKAAKEAAEEARDLLRPGVEKVRFAGPIPGMLASIQGQQAGLLEAVKQLASRPGSPVDLDAVKAASKAGAAEALADLEATATTTITLSQEG
ncbi:CHAP domain-containing protein [Paenarthrobacter ureafaciens]|uniref:CHAP domain-containing protein n=1 Tax=Paenarthrobacter ureafaciens TaxID=37931 RepID=UPI001FB1B06F|nr:CHAP domain-containing protein [Paenarthrobacter ureafaciens]UOD80366.1 CHAP domain-containing protein [Paenarthrobacter ureafaciens]WNZ03019.1 CHAP domain-containing protein [Paenarthrobacter ureafaciens]